MTIVHAILDASDARPLCGADSPHRVLIGEPMSIEAHECAACQRAWWAMVRAAVHAAVRPMRVPEPGTEGAGAG